MAFNRAAVSLGNLIPTATLNASSEASASMSSAKLKTPSWRERWRSTTAAYQQLTATTGQTEFWPLAYIKGHNLTGDGRVRFEISDNADYSSPSYDCTFGAYPSITGLDEGGLDEGGLDGLPLVDDFNEWQFQSIFPLDLVLTGTATAGAATSLTLPATLAKTTGAQEAAANVDDAYLGAGLRITGGTGAGQERTVAAYAAGTRRITPDTAFSPAPDGTSTFELDLSFPLERVANDGTYNGKYFRMTLMDASNPDGYLQAGVWLAGGYLQPDYDVDADLEAGWVDPSEWFSSYGNELFVEPRGMYQTGTLTWSFLGEGEANAFIHTLGAKVGRRTPLLALPFFENSYRVYTDAIYGYLNEAPRKRQLRRNPAGFSWQVSLSLRGL